MASTSIGNQWESELKRCYVRNHRSTSAQSLISCFLLEFCLFFLAESSFLCLCFHILICLAHNMNISLWSSSLPALLVLFADSLWRYCSWSSLDQRSSLDLSSCGWKGMVQGGGSDDGSGWGSWHSHSEHLCWLRACPFGWMGQR